MSKSEIFPWKRYLSKEDILEDSDAHKIAEEYDFGHGGKDIAFQMPVFTTDLILRPRISHQRPVVC